MPTVSLTTEQKQEAVDAFEKYGSKKFAAEALGLPWNTFDHRYRAGVKAGLDSAIIHPAPQGHSIKGVSTLYGPNGNIQAQWVKTKVGEVPIEEMIESIKWAFDHIESYDKPIPEPVFVNAAMLTLFCLADLHLALYAWAPEAGANWDLQIATERYRETMLQVAASAPPSETAVILIGGDYLHANTNDFRTQSGHVLDGDGRTDKVISVGISLAVFQIDLALQKHRRVIVRALKGNHDEYASIAIAQALKAWYRNEPRITIDTDPSLFWFHLHGKVLLGSTHGHTVKVTEMPLIMANRRAKEWGESTFRYVHMFHIHHKTQHVFEGGGVIAESHQSPVAQDSYHYGKGYLSGRSMQAITYHEERGEVARNVVAIL